MYESENGEIKAEAAEETKTLTLRESLSEQLEKQTQEMAEAMSDEKPEEAESEEVSEEVKEEDAEKETDGEEVAEEEGKEEATAELSEDKSEVKKTDEVDIPNNWNEEERKAFEDIPDEIEAADGTKISLKAMKDVVLHRQEKLLKAFYDSTDKNALLEKESESLKTGNEEWNKLLDPWRPQLTAAGMTEQQYIGDILNGVRNLQQNPAAVIKDLMGAYKVSAADLGINTGQSEDLDEFDGQVDPKVTELETTVDKLTKRLDDDAATRVQQQNQSVQDEVAAFKSAVDSDGNLLHPHFDESRDEMGILMQTGKAKTIPEAYEMSPTVRSKGLDVKDPKDEPQKDAALKEVNELNELKERRTQAAKAKKAGKTIKSGSGSATNHLNGLSLRDELKAGLQAMQ